MKKYSLLILAVSFVFVFFRHAFSIIFFKDDYFYYHISRISKISELVNFFSPIRVYSYKPLASEVFYFFINKNIFLGHLIVFITYGIGLYFLYKVIVLLTKNTFLAQTTVFLYGISSVHVFQLYWLATYQEVLVFAALTTSFFLYLKNKYTLSMLAYICALLSKETAILYIVFLFLYGFAKLVQQRSFDVPGLKLLFRSLVIYIVISFIFLLTYQYSLKFVTSHENYKMDFNLRRVLNNSMWYLLWGWGFPSMLPDYMPSIFSKPILKFWSLFASPIFKMYMYSFLLYFVSFISSVIFLLRSRKNQRSISRVLCISIIGFFLFLGPILLFPHRWMVRLTIPLIFISFFQGYIFSFFRSDKKYLKGILTFLIILYTVCNYFGVRVNENSSTYMFESSISNNASIIFNNKERFNNCNTLYVKDPKNMKMGSWDGSEKLALTFFGDSFLSYYFPGRKNMTVLYEYKTKTIPKGSCIVDAAEFIK